MSHCSSARHAVRSQTPIRVVLGALLLGVFVSSGAAAAPLCIALNSGGTAEVPALGCPFFSEPDPFKIEGGLPPGSTIEIEVEILPLALVSSAPGGSLGGNFNISDIDITLTMTGTGLLAGFNRILHMSDPDFETHYAPRTPGDAVQSFASDLFALDGVIFGDPDFDSISLKAGSSFGLPSPGSTTLTRLGGIGTNFEVDSFFDVFYKIEFVGAPGSVLDGFAGVTEGEARIQQGIDAPEPSALLLIGLALAGVAAHRRR